jgi:phenylalanyl-tRNA synthetase beta chain
MRISYNWLKNYIDFDIKPQELSEILTDCGLEVEGLERVESIKGGLEGILVGHVISKEKHPDADKLSLTKVDVGREEPLSIVCGAPNVDAGQKVIVATIGATLYNGDDSFKIKKSKIRGYLSEGMICAEDEVGLGNSHDGILVLDPSAKIGTTAKEYFNLKEDYVFEIGLTPNRADAVSHYGVARDLVAVLNQKYNTDTYKTKLPDVASFNIDNNDLEIKVQVEDAKACPRYTSATISGIEVKESPEWIKTYLNAIDVRPINNIVDITNFVLFELGQPLHAFDADKIKGEKIIVKKLASGTKFVTLDEEERELTDKDLMICDEQDGMCIAGVFGGIRSGVTENTKNIFLESAYFDPKTIRKTAKYHSLQTEASFRFERGADPQITELALKRALLLIKELAGGKISSSISDLHPTKLEAWEIDVNYSNIHRLIGKTLEKATIKKILIDLGITIVKESDENLLLSVPPFKVDVTRESDIIEEILRVYGYNNIEYSGQLKSSLSFTPKPDREKIQNLVSDYLSSNGFFEIMNNSLSNSKHLKSSEVLLAENNVPMMNPISQDLDVMRQTLLFGALEMVAYNQNRQNQDLKLYEFGRTYQLFKNDNSDALSSYREEKHLALILTGKKETESWVNKDTKIDFYDLKAIALNLLKRLGISINKLSIKEKITKDFQQGLTYFSGEKILMQIGNVNSKLRSSFDIKNEVLFADIHWDLMIKLAGRTKVQYKEIPKYPAVRRDLALLVNQDTKFADIERLAFKTERKFLKGVNLFDIYEGDKIEEGKKSYAVSFLLRDTEKTLTDKIIEKTMKRLLHAYESELNISIR